MNVRSGVMVPLELGSHSFLIERVKIKCLGLLKRRICSCSSIPFWNDWKFTYLYILMWDYIHFYPFRDISHHQSHLRLMR